MRKKILFLPIQTGYAHIIRSLAVADYMSRKYEIFFAIEKRKYNHFSWPKSIKVLKVDEYRMDNVMEIVKSMDNHKIAKPEIEQYISLLKKVKPDIVVNDLNIYAFAACEICNIRQIMIFDSEGIPYTSGIPGFFSASANLSQKLLSYPVELFFDWAKKTYIQKALNFVKIFGLKPKLFTQVLKETPMILHEIKEYIPLKKYLPNFYFVGPVFYHKIEGPDAQFEREIIKRAQAKKIIYLTFGGTGFGGEKLLNPLIKLFTSENFFVIVSTGNICHPNSIKADSNVFVKKFIPGLSAAKLANIIVSHGSYGSVMQSLYWGKPIVCLPFNLDQVYHGAKVGELKVGEPMLRYGFHHLLLNWAVQKEIAENIEPQKILSTVKRVLSNKIYAANAQKFSKKIQKLDELRKSKEIIEKILAEN